MDIYAMSGLIKVLIYLGFGLFVIVPMFFKVVKEYERAIIFRLGRMIEPKGPGLIFVIPIVDKVIKINLRLITLDVPPQDIITKDNVSVKVNAVVYYRVIDPKKAILEVSNYDYATEMLAQTELRSVLGEMELDDLLAQRDKINERLQEILDQKTDPWGIKVNAVELKHVDLPVEMQRAMAKQAEAERLRRAKVITAEGEYQAAAKLKEASDTLATSPISIQLRYLQTLTEIATEKNSTIVFPLPVEFLSAFLNKNKNT